VSRYLEGGLKSRKRGPRISPRRTPKEVEELVIGYRKRFKTIGQERIRLMLLKDHNISLSTRTINRILNAHNLIQKRRKKPHRKRKSRKYKEYLRGLEVFDTKDLQDIQPLTHKILEGRIPRYQFTARCPKTGFNHLAIPTTQ
jgi:hypothetical protein